MSFRSSSPAADALKSSKRLVIKAGSAILCNEKGDANVAWLSSIAADIAMLRSEGVETIIVTSGAIALGRNRLSLKGTLRLEEKQAASAAGQVKLAEAWQTAMAPHDIKVAQVLLTLQDTEERRRYLNARATIRTLLDLHALPLVNENDTVATSEIRYGDNDRLAAHTAQIAGADTLIILSDIDGLYTTDPRSNADAVHIPVVDNITPEITKSASGPNSGSGLGSGGMATKIAAAQIAGANGCTTIIAAGGNAHPIKAVFEGARATLFRPSTNKENARRQWIAGRIKSAGEISVDHGAAEAIHRGASLLPAGVTAINGEFRRGDAVSIIGVHNEILGQGLSAYDASDIKRIMGLSSEAAEQALGYRRRPAVIERNDLVLRKP